MKNPGNWQRTFKNRELGMFVLYSIEKEIDSNFDTIQKCVFSPNVKCIVIDLKYFA